MNKRNIYNRQIYMLFVCFLFQGIWTTQTWAKWTEIKPSNLGQFDPQEMPVVSWKNALWGVSRKSGVLMSTDFATWSRQVSTLPMRDRWGHRLTTYEDKLILTGDIWNYFNTDLFASDDGSNWFRIGYLFSPSLAYHTSLTFNDKLWLIGGYEFRYCDEIDGEDKSLYGNISVEDKYEGEWGCCEGIRIIDSIFYTDNGSNWYSRDAPGPGRASHTSVLFDNKMWVFGGLSGGCLGDSGLNGVLLNDVWSSVDGVTWVPVIDTAPWSPRSSHQTIVFRDKIWLLGGYTEEGPTNDVWYSANGIDWVMEENDAPWSPRIGHVCVVHNNILVLIGGYDANGRKYDIWIYEPDDEDEGEGEGEAETIYHSGDWHEKPDRRIDLTELLRIIQFYTSDGYSCAEPGDPLSDDGFLPGDGDRTCAPHAADYNPQDWRINLSEVLRIIQFYNSGGYRACEDGEDGFCPEM